MSLSAVKMAKLITNPHRGDVGIINYTRPIKMEVSLTNTHIHTKDGNIASGYYLVLLAAPVCLGCT